jgi:hypothetical protein
MGSCTPASQKINHYFDTTGAFKSIPCSSDAMQPSSWFQSGNYFLGFDASRSKATYVTNGKVKPLSLTFNGIIKY